VVLDGVGSGEADANAAVTASVNGWCVFPVEANANTTCTPVVGIKTYTHDAEMNASFWNYDWSADEACQDSNGTVVPGKCDKCQELPNHAVCSESAYETKGCDACLDNDVDLNDWVCYSPGLSTEKNFFDDPTADDFNPDKNQPHLPHDCGAMVTMRFLCQQCPSGCGPFRNKPSMLTYMQEDLATWDLKLSWVVQTINFMGTVTFTIIISLIFLMLYLTMSSKSAARQRKAEKFRTERDMERLDKLWILREYNITFEHATKMSMAGTPGGDDPLTMSHNAEFERTQLSLRQAARNSTVTDIGQF